ncbi:hypothetical protein TgHK011_002062 [Trichoderma gracile]|nr:hypothetical protein TgHK011_002062 [Trichoderma gracile]
MLLLCGTEHHVFGAVANPSSSPCFMLARPSSGNHYCYYREVAVSKRNPLLRHGVSKCLIVSTLSEKDEIPSPSGAT